MIVRPVMTLEEFFDSETAFGVYQKLLRLANIGADYDVFVVTENGEMMPKQLRFRDIGHYELFVRHQARRLRQIATRLATTHEKF